MLEEWTPSPCAPTLCSNWYLEVYTVHYNTNPKGAAVTSVGPQPPPMTFGGTIPRLDAESHAAHCRGRHDDYLPLE